MRTLSIGTEFLILILFLLLGLFNCDQATDGENNSEACLQSLASIDTTLVPEARWSSVADLNTSHQFHAAVVLDGKLYAVGGADHQTRSAAAFEEYDPATNSWAILENMPTPRSFLAVASMDQKIYTIGGIGVAPGDTTSDFQAAVEVYQINERRWSRLSDLPTPRNRFAAVAYEGHLYTFGGLGEGFVDTGVLEVYDPTINKWLSRAAMPTPRHGHATVVIDDKILVIGGYAGVGPVPTVEAYDPLTDTWSTRADMPTPRGFLGAAIANGYVYALAGRLKDASNPIERYNPCLDEWTTVGSVPGRIRNRFGSATLDNQIYVVGGEFQGDEELPKSVLVYNPG